MSNISKLEEIATQIRHCQKCDLHKSRTNTVPGDGAPDAKLIIIGEAPGAQEDKQGLPFVGPAGKILIEALTNIGLERKDVFITNTVKCRPPENRDPLPEEKSTCANYLEEQISIIKPKIFLLLGKHSLQKVFPDANITSEHGKFKIKAGHLYFITFHPAATIYNQALRPQLFQDFKILAKIIHKIEELAPIIDKLTETKAEKYVILLHKKMTEIFRASP